jgi:sulfite reductase (ferredoxin)
VTKDDGKSSTVEIIKETSVGLRGPIAAEVAGGDTHFSETARQVLKFHGVYEQDDRDVRRERKDAGEEPAYAFMVRAKLPGGVLTADQYLVFDDIADRYANGTLRVTTRQDFQLHGVLKGDLKTTIRAVNDALITTLGACGDIVRNVVTCPAPVPGGLRDQALALASQLSSHLLPRTRAYHEIWLNGEAVDTGRTAPEPDPLYGTRYLPRKFKIGFGFPDDNCCDVHSNDLGLLTIAEPGGNQIEGFNVLVGGGLGATHGKKDTYPRLASVLGFTTVDEIVRVAEAVVAVHRDHGDRGNRKHARLKYMLDDHGIDWFREQVEARLGHPLAEARNVDVSEIHDHLGWHEQGAGQWFRGVFVENGRIRDDEHAALRTALRQIVTWIRPGIRLTTQQNLLLTDIPEHQRALVDRILDDHGVPSLDHLSTLRRWAMACPALPTCGLALAESERVLPGLIDALERELARLELSDAALTVRMTGCPNGCARPYTADLAFVGRSADRYTVFVGGSMLGTRLGTAFADLVPRDQLVATVLPLLERYRIERLPGERFGDFHHRVGITPANARPARAAAAR